LTLIYNQNYGLIVQHGHESNYFDVDLGLGSLTKQIFIITYKG